jgi:hypothetical protein
MVPGREVAWRVFAGEYNVSDLEHSSGEERAASYVITPLGAKVNRLMVVGVITDLENAGTEAEPLWKARVSDPTGVFYISAGQYQPEAARALSKMKAPSFAAIIGKSRIYKPEDGGVYLSIRPEVVRGADEKLRSLWVLDACRSLKNRIDAMEEAADLENPAKEQLRALGYSDSVADGIMLALQHYRDKLDIGRYRAMLRDALKFIVPQSNLVAAGKEGIPGQAGGTEVDGGEAVGLSAEDPEAKIVEQLKEEEDEKGGKKPGEQEEKVLEIIARLDKSPKGVAYETIIENSKKEGIGQEELEEVFNGLLDKGLVYEPILGRVKVVKGK